MRPSHARRAIHVRFDDPNLVSCGGLVAVMALAARCGLPDLLADRLTVAGDLPHHGGMPRVFEGVRAPSTLGTFLRLFRFGHIRQLATVAAALLARLAAATPLLPDAAPVTFLDIDDAVEQNKAPGAATRQPTDRCGGWCESPRESVCSSVA